MAISKILHMKDTGSSFHGRHLKRALDYVMNPEKTQDGRLTGGINCQPDTAFEQMKETKRKFGKTDKRQGYHLVISFQEGEADPDLAYEFTQKFVEEFLGKSYEAVYAVHDNTEHVHSHIIFNSVSFVDGKKFRYEKGDWAGKIQPITNRLCEEYGLSVLDIEEEQKGGRKKDSGHYREWNDIRDGRFVWSDMIRRDLDACIIQARDYGHFLELLSDKGYEIKQGKHLAVKPPGMKKFRRLDTLGGEYTQAAIELRIPKEDLRSYQRVQAKDRTKIVRCKVRRCRRAKLSGLQKRYFKKLYRTGQLKRRPYSQVWRYRDDIRRMQNLQNQYLFLAFHDIHSPEELAAVIGSLSGKKKEVHAEKSRVYRARQKCQELFDAADRMSGIVEAERAYQQGDGFFSDEHDEWEALETKLREQGYSYGEVMELKAFYRASIAECVAKEKAVSVELRTGEAIWKDISRDSGDARTKQEEVVREEKEKQEKWVRNSR